MQLEACSLPLDACNMVLASGASAHGPGKPGPLVDLDAYSSFFSSIYFLDRSWSSLTKRSTSSSASAILFSCSFSILYLSILMSRYLVFNTHQPQRVRSPIELIINPILSHTSCQACSLKLGACSFNLKLNFLFNHRLYFFISRTNQSRQTDIPTKGLASSTSAN